MKKNPKNRHIVPRAYLKRFTDDGEHAYAFLKSSNKIIDGPINIRNLCAEKGFYSSYDSYGAKPGKTFTNYKGKVNFINKKGTHPYHVTTPSGGWLGWVTAGSVTLA